MDKRSNHHADLHVERLHYIIESGPAVKYEKPAPLSLSHPIGEFRAEDGKLVVAPTDHFANEEEARAIVDPILRAWEIQTDLRLAIGTIRFRFDHADIIDRSPRQPGSVTVPLAGVSSMSFAGSLTAVAVRNAYPPPPAPQTFSATSDVRTAHQRWCDFVAGREQLTGGAYFVLTVLENQAGGRKKAAKMFQIHMDVLRRVADLTTNKGGPAAARKARGISQPLTESERGWLQEVVKLMIQRMAQVAAGSTVPMVNMKDLPRL